VIVSVADCAPVAVGLNVIVTEALFPAAIVCGRDSPLTVKTELFVLAAEIVTLLPVAVSVPVAVPLEPSVTFPTAMVVGEIDNCPGTATPVPVAVAVRDGLDALLSKVNVELAAPAAVGVNVTLNETLWPEESIAGRVSPLNLNVALFDVIEFTVTAPPLAVSVPVVLPLLPTLMLPTAKVVGETDSTPGGTVVPVPVAVAVKVELDAVLAIVRLALAEPVAVGLKLTVNVALCPSVIVTGNVSPLIVNAALSEVTLFTVTLPPFAVSVPAAAPLPPTITAPTANVAGEIDSVPIDAVPTPVRDAVNGESEMLVVKVAVATKFPAPTGANCIVRFALCPGPIETGKEGAVIENEPLETEAELMLAEAVPEFVTVTVKFLVVPDVMVPKSRLCEPSVKSPVGVTLAPALTP
jgi:hypothetical protein